MSSAMEVLEEALFMDSVPENWTIRAYPSMLPLGQWFADFMVRLKELESWASDFQVSFFNRICLRILSNIVWFLVAFCGVARRLLQPSIFPDGYHATNST